MNQVHYTDFITESFLLNYCENIIELLKIIIKYFYTLIFVSDGCISHIQRQNPVQLPELC